MIPPPPGLPSIISRSGRGSDNAHVPTEPHGEKREHYEIFKLKRSDCLNRTEFAAGVEIDVTGFGQTKSDGRSGKK